MINHPIQSEAAESYRDRRLRQLRENGYEVHGDEVLIPSFSDAEEIINAALAAGKDPHDFMAREMYGGEKPTPEQRYMAKTWNFPVLYGLKSSPLERIKPMMTTDEAKQVMRVLHQGLYCGQGESTQD